MDTHRSMKSSNEINIFTSPSNHVFDSKEKNILDKCHKFFSFDQKYIGILTSIVNRESEISLRVLDWFVTNYSKKHNTCYKIKNHSTEEIFYVNNEYKNQLNGYSKKYFDSFCRTPKVIYTHNISDKYYTINTSIGQLNFFQWAIRNKVIKYTELHLDKIIKDMKDTTILNEKLKLSESQSSEKKNTNDAKSISSFEDTICSTSPENCITVSSNKKSDTISTSDGKPKRRQLSKIAYGSGIKKTNVSIVLDFD